MGCLDAMPVTGSDEGRVAQELGRVIGAHSDEGGAAGVLTGVSRDPVVTPDTQTEVMELFSQRVPIY